MAVNASEIVEIANYIQHVKKVVAMGELIQERQRRVAANVGDSSMTALYKLMEQHNQQLHNLQAAVSSAESFTRDIDKVHENLDKVHEDLDNVHQAMIRPISRTLTKLQRTISQYLFEATEKKCISMLNFVPEKKWKEFVDILNVIKRDRQIYLESHPLNDVEAEGGNTTAEVVDAFKKMKIESKVVELFSRL
ncbi:PREDICTED: uncharacterized protein LOC109183661 [Ipomoea nil]|uniref:uncharacterized protein LOC109183661 n=1 Tax=Ipomoea nil TaxID=35883 RepID=UPI000900A89F|nr:PREDICTED: uncharacterized protein LOC109183661 [Ipomoea nil]